MGFAVVLSPEAERRLDQLPPIVASFLLDELDRLAANPHGLSVKAHFPYPPIGQAFRTQFEHDDVRYFFYIAFRYGQDEQSLYVEFIAMNTRP